jgi:hypothetical protein
MSTFDIRKIVLPQDENDFNAFTDRKIQDKVNQENLTTYDLKSKLRRDDA